ncbi:MAG TPA: MtnX-like HAD-IB family phosphatase [Candidatus Kapabacteria bacterium]|nr:MtnX-like HAD-IB family phosphatase [Candidatus Kapabacteria bacterium]
MNKSKKQIYVFCDFDGTIALKDIGDELFKTYSKFEPYRTQLLSKEISVSTYWNKLCQNLPVGFSKKDILNFIKDIDIDPYFNQFVKLCNENAFPLKIVSDGFSDYIIPFLEMNNIDGVEVASNYLSYDNHIKPHFPGATESCNCFSASCKRNAVLKNVADEAYIVYIGDGYSDYCPIEYADIIFAKKSLARYCNDNKIPHYNYTSFFDIIRIFKEIIILKLKLKHRRQAELKRIEAYYIE